MYHVSMKPPRYIYQMAAMKNTQVLLFHSHEHIVRQSCGPAMLLELWVELNLHWQQQFIWQHEITEMFCVRNILALKISHTLGRTN